MSQPAAASNQTETPPVLPEGDFFQADYKRYDGWCMTSATPEQVRAPGFWAGVAKNLKPADIIEVVHENFDWAMDLMVVDAGDFHAVTRVKSFSDWRTENEVDTKANDGDTFYVKWRGGDQFCILKVSDDAVVHRKESDKSIAQKRCDQMNREARVAAIPKG